MKSGFFNSQIIGTDDVGMPIFDRAQPAEFFALFFKSYFTNGIFPTPSTAGQVLAGGGMSVIVQPVSGHIEGYFFVEDTPRKLVLQAAQALPRIDRVVYRLNLVTRNIDYFVIQGTPATTPVAPTLTRWSDAEAGDIYELAPADIFIPANVNTVAQERITDTRLNSELCGVVTQTVHGLDSTDYFLQLQAMLESSQTTFEEWFATIQDILDENTAGHLLNLIENLINTNQITLTASGWTGTSAPFTQTVSIPSMRASQVIIPGVVLSGTTANQLNQLKAWRLVNDGDNPTDGSITFTCLKSKPTINLTVKLAILGGA